MQDWSPQLFFCGLTLLVHYSQKKEEEDPT
jgi:hypothetical protein